MDQKEKAEYTSDVFDRATNQIERLFNSIDTVSFVDKYLNLLKLKADNLAKKRNLQIEYKNLNDPQPQQHNS